MFDVGFSELVLIFVIGLVVLGPKRLPIAIRTVMGWVRTIRGLATNVQNELAQELKLQELQESIKKAEALNLSQLSPELSKTVEELKQSAQKIKGDLASAQNELKALSDEQVAEIQEKIAQENEQLAHQVELQKVAEITPLEQQPSAETAELAEADEEKLTLYYPPDDELASTSESDVTKDKQNVS